MAGVDDEPAARAPFGRYRLDALIARGGMGEVFRAVAVGAGGFEKPVVVKRILPSLGGVEAMSSMFIEEARLMSRLLHPNIVQVIDFGQGESDDYFLVMELVDGVDLRVFQRWFHEHAADVPVGLAAYVATQILRGLGHAHDKAYRDGRTLVHRDVSPGNVLLSRVGEVKVADFGVALVARPGGGDEPGTLAGKPGYMAPEQIFGGSVDGRADLFSVGVVLHLLLTGVSPFVGDDETQRRASANLGRLRDVEALRPGAGPELAAVIRQALAPEPGERFSTARAMSKAIEGACRASHIALATADELAEHVERVADTRGQEAKKVVALGESSVQRELTRTGAHTMRVSATQVTDVTSFSTVVERSPAATRPAPTAPVAEPSVFEPVRLPLAPSPSWIGVVVGCVGLAFVGWWLLREPAPPPASVAPAVPLGTTQPSLAVAPASAIPSSVAPESPPARPSVTRQLPARPPPSTVAPAGCEGKVLLSGKGSWWVSGGPTGRVQAPGMYTWRCGSYGLSGTSRVDQRVVSRAVTVRDGVTATARFE